MTGTQSLPRPVAGVRPRAVPEGLQRAGARPPLWAYLRQFWGRRHFVVAYTRATSEVKYSNNLLGQLWQVLTPLINFLVYYLIFGLLLHISRGTDNYVAFLVVGVFFFHFIQQSVMRGARAIVSNQGLIRSVHFPRATLPVSTTGMTLIQLGYALVVLIPIVLLTGEPLTLRWLGLIPTIVFVTGFSLGMALVFARLAARVPDVIALLPFLMRAWLYFSGVIYNIDVVTKHHPTLQVALNLNPAATYVELARTSMLSGHPVEGYVWVSGVVWCVVMLVVGTVYFWAGEESYARG